MTLFSKMGRVPPSAELIKLAHSLLPFSFTIQYCSMFPSIAHGSYEDVSSFLSFTTVVQY